MFSVIIPLYNKERYIEHTIQSVLNQTFKNFEIIVVDDGSIDNGLSVVRGIKDNRIKIFSKQNEGVSIARNYGVERASFNYICFLDADDEWRPKFLETMKYLIEKYTDINFFSIATLINYENQQKIDIKNQQIKDFIVEDYCKEQIKYRKSIIHTGSCCCNKDVFLAVGGFPAGIKYGEDLDTWLRISCKTKLAFSTDVQFIYNYGTENSTIDVYHSKESRFPYWYWYKYKYFNKKSLWLYTTKLLLSCIKYALVHKKFNDVIFYVTKIRIFNFKYFL